MKERQHLSSLWYRIAQNIDQDFLEIFIVTSQAAGLEPSVGRSFGVGKSTLAIWMGYRAHAYAKRKLWFDGNRLVDEATPEERIAIMKEVLDNYVVWRLDDLINAITKTEGTIPAIIWDDTQFDCPAYQHIPDKKRKQIEFLTMTRQRLCNLILTAPSISDIAKPLRRNISWEVIIPDRGTYEIQFLAKRRDFYNPVEDVSRLWYEATGNFEALPEEIDLYYKKLRDRRLNKSPAEEEKEEEERKETAEIRPLQKCPYCNYEWHPKNAKRYYVCPRCYRFFKNPLWEEESKLLVS